MLTHTVLYIFRAFYPLPPTHRPQGSMTKTLRACLAMLMTMRKLVCHFSSVSSAAKWGGGFDLAGHSGHEFNIIPAKHLAQHWSSGRCTELVEVEDVQIWETPCHTYASNLESGPQLLFCVLLFGEYSSSKVILRWKGISIGEREPGVFVVGRRFS